MTLWMQLIWAYVAIAFGTFLPTLKALLIGVKLNEGGASFEESEFTKKTKRQLVLHYSRLQGTLGFWKKNATV